MGKTVAIFAHFDVDAQVDTGVLEILECLSEICDEIDFVTTSPVDLDKVDFPDKVRASRRANVGYDFYSYKTGLVRVLEDEDVERVFLVNSSFLLVDPERFRAALREMLHQSETHDAVGATASRQMSWHLQSYLLLLTETVLNAGWFTAYVNSIQPQNEKLQLIMTYELGLSRLLAENGVQSAALFEPSFDYSDPEKENISNPVHMFAREVAETVGIVKTELLRNNQHKIDISFVTAMASPAQNAVIDAHVSRLSARYSLGPDNMSSLSEATQGVPAYRMVRWQQPGCGGVKIAVAAHMFYASLAQEFCEQLANIVEPFDVFLTTPFEADVPQLINTFSQVAESVNVAVCENRGRDVGPFIALYRAGEFDRYDAVLKIHSKKSKYSDQGDHWRRELLQSLTGTSYKALQSIRLLREGGSGIVGPHGNYLTHSRFWGANQASVNHLLTASGCLPEGSLAELGFFAGSMFWFRPEALAPLRRLQESDLDFAPENGLQDGTLAHALERTFAAVARSEGFTATSIYLDGQDIHDPSTRTNRVPVL